jgi:hypothetical protein
MCVILICILNAKSATYFSYSYTVSSLIKEVQINSRGKYIFLFWK